MAVNLSPEEQELKRKAYQADRYSLLIAHLARNPSHKVEVTRIPLSANTPDAETGTHFMVDVECLTPVIPGMGQRARPCGWWDHWDERIRDWRKDWVKST